MEGCYLNVVVGRRQGKGGEETEEAEADQDQPRGHDGGYTLVTLLRCHTLVTRAVNGTSGNFKVARDTMLNRHNIWTLVLQVHN